MNNLQNALDIYMDNDIRELEEAMQAAKLPDFSTEFEARMKQLINSASAEKDISKTVRRSKDPDVPGYKTVRVFGRQMRRALVIAAVLILILAMTVTSVAIIKPEIFFNIWKGTEDWSIFPAIETAEDSIERIDPITPEAPAGYEIINTSTDKTGHTVEYSNGKGSIYFSQKLPDSIAIYLDAEGEIHETMIGDQKAIVASHDDGGYTIVIENDKNVFIISGDCDYDALYEIAYSAVTAE